MLVGDGGGDGKGGGGGGDQSKLEGHIIEMELPHGWLEMYRDYMTCRIVFITLADFDFWL